MSFRMKRPPFKAFGDEDWEEKDRNKYAPKRQDAFLNKQITATSLYGSYATLWENKDYWGIKARGDELAFQESMEIDPVTGAYVNPSETSPASFKMKRRRKIYGKRRKRK